MRDLVDELLRARVKARLFGEFRAPTLGRLEIVEELGSGAMGTVFAAYDPRLDRKVAVKVLRDPGTDGARVLREARALGKLAHPNVVAIHDAEDLDGTIYIVMELGPGTTLRKWLPHPWRETVAVLLQAGAGLAAAHQRDLVHRDIKPDNILVGDDRTRVVDLGLAGVGGDETAAGTPAYMAPEVLGGAPASPASDQFSFAVTCYEAIAGTRPYAGATRAEIAVGASRAASAKALEPAWLHAVIARGLAADPADRFDSMIDMLEAFDRGLSGARRRRRGVALVAALAIGGALGAVVYRSRATRDPCAGAADRRAEAWSPELAAKVNRATAPWGDRAVAALDAFGARWETSYREVCEATRVRGEQSDALLELRMRCLDRSLDRLGTLAGALGEPLDAAARANAVVAIAELPAPGACATVRDAGELALPADPKQREMVLEAEHALDRGWALYGLARYADASKTLAEIEPVNVPALHASTLALGASIEARIGAAPQARLALQAALQAAAAAGSSELELELWARLLRLELFASTDARAVLEIEPFARIAAARAHREGAEIDGIVGEARRNAGELVEARAMLKRALASHDPLRADQRAVIEMNLGSVELADGDPKAAEAAFVHAEGLARSLLGEGHPELALYADKLAAAERAQGRLREALVRCDASLAVRARAFGPDDRSVATSLYHRAETLLEAGQLSRARADLDRARVIRVKAWGDHSTRLDDIDRLLAEVAAAAVHSGFDTSVAKAFAASIGLYDMWSASRGHDAALACAIGSTLAAAGEPAHAETVFIEGLAMVSEEPSRNRLCILEGLHRDVTALRAAMPELGPRDH